ncbi:hypothetical protein CDV55_100873 [Aspergillus turcosus]|nr:hypothetical protein CDV55_100873 [Aspergillus turcosus]
MQLPAIVPPALLGISFVFAVIELGLAGHIASTATGSRRIPVYDGSSAWGYSYKTIKFSVPAIVAFVIFTAVWTMLVSVAAILLPWFFRARAAAGSLLNTILTGALGAAYFVTMVFWLASFADIAAKLDGLGATSDYYNAVIAFAVLLWLLFAALFVVVVLALVGVLQCDVPGYRGMRKRGNATEGTQMQTVEVA